MLTAKRFLWATLQLDWICKQRSDNDIKEELLRLPPDLHGTYDHILERINHQPPKLQEVARKALMWVLYAERPLTIDELSEAIAIEPSIKTHKDLKTKLREEDVIISSTGALLTVDSEYDRTVRPIHTSVQEYLTKPCEDQTKTRILKYFIDGELAHSQLAMSCMTYLQLDIFVSGPSSDAYALHSQCGHAQLACYSCFLFDKHIQHLNALPPEIHTRLNLVLGSEERTLAAVLQCRRLRGSYHRVFLNFSKCSSAVNAATLIYSTDLYNILQCYRPDSNWLKLAAPLTYALHQAAANNSEDAIERLVELGHNINEPDEDGMAPLYHAAVNGHSTSTKWLLEHGAEVNSQGGDYNTALQAASFGGHLAVVELLLKHEAQVDLQGGIYNTALQAASSRGHLAVVELLLKHEAQVDLQGGNYNTALQAASLGGHLAVVELLLKHEAQVDLQGGNYNTALQAASLRGHLAVVELLLKHKAQVNLQGGNYNTALQAASSDGHLAVVELLLKHEAQVDLQGGIYNTALQAASSRGHLAVVELLLKHEAQVDLQGGNYNTALQAASTFGHLAVVELLLKHGAESTSRSLVKACGEWCQDDTVAKLLLENGAEVTAEALEDASEYGWYARYQMLLDYQERQKERIGSRNADLEKIDEGLADTESILDI
jgi:ankyrin repeat protein